MVDTNVLLDLVLIRDGFKEASMLLELAKQKKIKVLIALHSYTNLWYITTQKLKISPTKVLTSLSKIKSLTEILPIHDNVLEMSLQNPNPDFEDALILYAARDNAATKVISNDLKMVRSNITPCCSPGEFLEEKFYTE